MTDRRNISRHELDELDSEGFGSTSSEAISRLQDEMEVDLDEWRRAAEIVRRVRPVPRVLSIIIRSVYGRSGEPDVIDSVTFIPVEPLLRKALADNTLAPERSVTENERAPTLSQIVESLGSDMAGALCFMHSVCRRVRCLMPERIWGPIIDDALLRAAIGYWLGRFSKTLSSGRAMLGGFSGRAGLAILMASGEEEEALEALASLAVGSRINEVCRRIYGCTPLEVSSVAMVAGGCSRDVALGIMSFDSLKREVVPGTESYQWLAVFSAIENIRMGRMSSTAAQYWTELGYSEDNEKALCEKARVVQRQGHGWAWLSEAQIPLEDRDFRTIAIAEEDLIADDDVSADNPSPNRDRVLQEKIPSKRPDRASKIRPQTK